MPPPPVQVVGEDDLAPHLSPLNSSQHKLLAIYVERASQQQQRRPPALDVDGLATDKVNLMVRG